MRATALVLAALLALAGCGARGALTFAPEAAAVGTVETVIVATSRARVDGATLFGPARSEALSFARFAVAVPPERARGTLRFPEALPPDPRTDFVTVGAARLAGEAAFVAEIDRALADDPRGAPRAAIFVHGYNTNFAEGLYRQAQLQYDYDSHAASVHFAWPSAASLRGYVYDQDSALFSRPGLERTLDAMARSRAGSINVLAHSMGAFLAMETLAIMARSGHDAFFERLNAVILISPDVEPDVFRTQGRAVLARGVPIFVIVSGRDRALMVSARIRGERERLGSIRSKQELGDLDIVVVDLSAVDPGSGLGHFAVAESPELIALLRGFREDGVDILGTPAEPGILDASVALIQQGTEFIFAPVTAE